MPPKKTKPQQFSSEENIETSLDLNTVKELINAQTESFKIYVASAIRKEIDQLKSHFNGIITDLNSKVRKLAATLHEIVTSLENSQKEISDLKEHMNKQGIELAEKTRHINDLSKELDNMKNKIT